MGNRAFNFGDWHKVNFRKFLKGLGPGITTFIGIAALAAPFDTTNWPPTIHPNSTVHYFVADPNANFSTPSNWKQSLSFAEDGDQAYETFLFKKTTGLQSIDAFMNIADADFKAWSNAPVVDVLLQVYGNSTLLNDDGSPREVTFRIGALNTENPVRAGLTSTSANNGQWNWVLFRVTNPINSATGKRHLGDVPNSSLPGVDYGGVNRGTIRIENLPGVAIRAVAVGEQGAFGEAEAINVFTPASPEWINKIRNGIFKRPSVQKVSDIMVVRDVEFGTGGGRPLHANLAYPKNPPASPMPAVIWIHGGGWEGGSYQDNGAERLAQKGYFTATIEYRLSDEAKWPAQVEDCKLAVRWLRANAAKYNVNPERIGVWGHSAGGHLAACLGTMPDGKQDEGISSRVQAVVDYSGPSDFAHGSGGITGETATNDAPMLVKLFGGTFATLSAVWRSGSPAEYVSKSSAPFLVVHGDKDDIVPIEQSETLVAALKNQNIPVKFIRVTNGDHLLRRPANSDQPAVPNTGEINAAVLEFFDSNLKK
jgi:acetyl esterase/lipase